MGVLYFSGWILWTVLTLAGFSEMSDPSFNPLLVRLLTCSSIPPPQARASGPWPAQRPRLWAEGTAW